MTINIHPSAALNFNKNAATIAVLINELPQQKLNRTDLLV